MQMQNKVLFFIVVVILLVFMYFMQADDYANDRRTQGSGAVAIEAEKTP